MTDQLIPYVDPMLQYSPVRKEDRVKIRVFVTPHSTSIVRAEDDAESNFVPHGWNEVIVYKRDLDRIKADSFESDPGAVQMAKLAHELALNAFVSTQTKTKAPEDRSQWTDEQRKWGERYGGSPEAEFQRLMGRDIRPLSHFEVLEDVAPPMTSQEKGLHGINMEQQRMMADAIAKGIAEGIAKAQSSLKQNK